MRRSHMSRKSSKRLFSRTAKKTHKRNLKTVSRGGYRI